MFSKKSFCFLTLFIYSASSDDLLRGIFNYTRPGLKASSPQAAEEYYDLNMTISLDKQPTFGNNEIFGDFVSINRNNVLKINFANINPNISFIIFQVHAHKYPVSLYKNFAWPNSTIQATHLGFYSDVVNKKDVFYLTNVDIDVDLSVYVSVHGYRLDDPVPGGCNMESIIPIAPFVDLGFKGQYLLADAAPPRDPSDPNCKKPEIYNLTSLVFYMMYTPEFDFSRETYFDAIKRMSTLEGIQENGVVVPKTNWFTRRMVASYPAIGAVFVAVAYRDDGYAVYIPNHSYGCVEDDLRCILSGDWKFKLFCLGVFVLSASLCFLGHRHFKSEMFIVAFFTAFFVSCSIFSEHDNVADILYMLLLCAIGVVFAGLWVLSWWIFGLPVFVVLPSAFNVGVLVAATIYYRLPNIEILQSNFNFWALFSVVVLLVTLALVSVAHFGNLLSCAFLGSFGIVLSIDLCIGANLKYILINFIRRAEIPKFNYAVLMPPFQISEQVLTVLWVFFAISGLVFQYWYNRGRPPFPPPPRGPRTNPALYGTYNRINPRVAAITTTRNNERTPLLT